MTATAEAAIVTEGLTKRYEELVAVDHLDFQISKGEIFGLLGPNGAGKTTTILMLLGLSEPTEGQARVVDLDPTRHPLEVKRVVGYVPDNVGFYPDLTGRQNLEYTAKLNRISSEVFEPRIQTILEQIGLADAADRPAGTYSRGMRQRLGITDALVKEPQILILDEPTIGIDPEGTRELLELIRNLRDDRGVTVLLSSHLLHQVQSICDRVGIFVRGRMIAQGPVRELAARHVAEEVITELAVTNWERAGEALWTVPGIKRIDRQADHWLLVSEKDVRPEVSKVLVERGIGILHLRRRDEGLDEIYTRYFEEEGSGRIN